VSRKTWEDNSFWTIERVKISLVSKHRATLNPSLPPPPSHPFVPLRQKQPLTPPPPTNTHTRP